MLQLSASYRRMRPACTDSTWNQNSTSWTLLCSFPALDLTVSRVAEIRSLTETAAGDASSGQLRHMMSFRHQTVIMISFSRRTKGRLLAFLTMDTIFVDYGWNLEISPRTRLRGRIVTGASLVHDAPDSWALTLAAIFVSFSFFYFLHTAFCSLGGLHYCLSPSLPSLLFLCHYGELFASTTSQSLKHHWIPRGVPGESQRHIYHETHEASHT